MLHYAQVSRKKTWAVLALPNQHIEILQQNKNTSYLDICAYSEHNMFIYLPILAKGDRKLA